MRRSLIGFLCLIALHSAAIAAPAQPVLEAWAAMNFGTLHFGSDAPGETATYTYELMPPDEARVGVSYLKDRLPVNGTMMMVGGRVLLTKNISSELGYELDQMDGAILPLFVTKQLLAFATEAVPDAVAARKEIDLHEQHEALTAGTASSDFNIEAPWTAKGWIERRGAAIAFRLTLHGKTDEDEDARTLVFDGSLEHRNPMPRLPDSLSLDGWRIFSVGPTSDTHGSSTILDYAARPDAKKYRTLGELRKAVQEQEAQAPKPQADADD